MNDQPDRLRRTLSLPMVVLYGLGSTIGAGIYALTGEIAALAGYWTPVAFLLSAAMAGFTGLSFAELSARYPRSAGPALYISRGLGSDRLGTLVGLLLVAAACISSAAVTNGFVGYLNDLVAVSRTFAIVLLVVVLGGVAAWGIRQSVGAAAAVTLLEVGGLLLIIGFGAPTALEQLPVLVTRATAGVPLTGILMGALLAFYAFLGFEDMVTVAEEVKRVRTALPAAIILTLLLTAVLYLCIGWVAVASMAPGELSTSAAPLAEVYRRLGGPWPAGLAVIGTLAMINGALIQIIMASRVLYGLADQGALPARLASVSPRTRTPLLATTLVTAVTLILALGFPLTRLAETTSVITLVVFTLTNLALLRIKLNEQSAPDHWRVPVVVPLAGAVISLAFVVYGLLA